MKIINYQLSIKKYLSYKDSTIDWIDEVPEHWEEKRIKDLSFLQSGNNITSEQIEHEGKYPVFGGNGLRGYFSQYTNSGDYILIGRQGALCGNINYASGKFWATEHAVVVYLKRLIHMKWYGASLNVMNLNQYSISAAQPGLAVERIKRLLLPVPPLSEQKSIATYLDTKTAQIDRKIDLLTQKAKLYQELRRSIINQAVTRGLDRSVAMKDSGIDAIGEVPEHWDIRRLKDLSDIQNSNVDKKSNDNEIPIKLCNYVDVYKNDFISPSLNFMDATANKAEIKRFAIIEGDVFITKDSETCDDIAIPALAIESLEGVICGYHLAQFRVKKKVFLGSYLFRLFQSQSYGFRFVVSAKGITRVGLGQSAIADSLTPVPPLTEQKSIATYFNTKTAQIDQIIQNINTQIEKLKELRKTLINDVVTGRIKVTEPQ